MRNILLQNGPVITAVLAVLEGIIAVLLLIRYKKEKRLIRLLMALVAFGLTYDAAVLACGSFLPEGALKPLSQLRFIFHGTLIPLLLPICAEALGWKKKAKAVVWIVTSVLMLGGLVSGILTRLEPSQAAGITRYLSGKGTPAPAERFTRILSYGTVVPLIAAGIVCWIRKKDPCLFLAGLLMFAFSALGPATGNFDLIFLIGMFGELFMVFFFLLYGRKKK